ncbi:MAG: RsmB/NOP family class I SAM-dependent RNA methyltransferase [Candidatus Anstonellales archaeon]
MEYSEYKGWLSGFTREDANEFLLNIKPTIRVNEIKTNVYEFLEFSRLKLERAVFENAFYVFDENIKLGNTIEYFLGYIHTQSLGSMLPPVVLNPRPGSKVYDVCAAPGSKTTQMAAMMKNTGIIYANDVRIERISALVNNINRLGVLNTIITQRSGTKLLKPGYFDFVLVDAPCSGLGSSPYAYAKWQVKDSLKISGLQKQILLSSFDSLKPGGVLVYSTCTYTKEENEEVIRFLLERRENARLETINIPYEIPHETGLSEFGNEFRKVWRVYPWHLKSEGFFIAKVIRCE